MKPMRLSRLVGNLLDMTRLESGVELRRDLYPLEEIVGAALQRMEPQLKAATMSTDAAGRSAPGECRRCSARPSVVESAGERDQIYAARCPSRDRRAPASGNDQDSVIIEVRDRGPGIPPGNEERIFEKFYRGKSDGIRGAGLGLPICRAIVEAHRGTIRSTRTATAAGPSFRFAFRSNAK